MFGIIMGLFFVICIPLFIAIMLFLRKGKLLIFIGIKMTAFIFWIFFVCIILIVNWVLISKGQLVWNGTKTIGNTGIPRKTTERIFHKPGTLIPGYHLDLMRHATTVLYYDQNGVLFGQQIFIRKKDFAKGVWDKEVTVYYNPENPKEVVIPSALFYFYKLGVPHYIIAISILVLEVLLLFFIIYTRFKGLRGRKILKDYNPLISIPNKDHL